MTTFFRLASVALLGWGALYFGQAFNFNVGMGVFMVGLGIVVGISANNKD